MTSESDSADLFSGDGNVRAALRAHDWSATTLGAEAAWSPALRSSLLHILWSPFPNLVLWGADLVQLYNDAYLDLIGDQRFAGLGAPVRDGALHDRDIEAPIYARVLAGETISREGARFTVLRGGASQTLYLTLSYAPIHDEHLAVAGVLVTVFEAEEGLSETGRSSHRRDMPPRLRQADFPAGRPPFPTVTLPS